MKCVTRYRAATLVAALLVAARTAAAPKAETWTEVKSPNFIVTTNSSEKDGRRVAIQFEQVRAVFMKYLPKAKANAAEPIRILGVKGETDFRALLPEFYEAKGTVHPGGVFQAGQERNYVVVRLDAESETSYQVLYHEYTHFLLHLNYGQLPVWLNEGLAEFFGHMQIREHEVLFGTPSWLYIRLLQTERWIPMDNLFAVGHDSPYYNEANKASIFYAQSWALVHYLILEGKRGSELNSYIHKLAGEHAMPVEAAHQAFGDPAALTKALQDCLRAGRFMEYSMKFPAQMEDATFSSRILSPAESLAVRGDFLAYSRRPNEARPLLEEAVKLDPSLALPHESLGVVALNNADFSTASKEFDRAVELDSRSPLAFFFSAQAMVQKSGESSASLKQAETLLRRAVALNPEFAPAQAQLASVMFAQNENLNEALQHAVRATSQQPGEPEFLVTAGSILLKLDRVEEALDAGDRAKALAQNDSERFDAQQLIDSAQRAVNWQHGAHGSGQPELGTPDQNRASNETKAGDATSPGDTPSGPAEKFEGVVQESQCDGLTLYLGLEGESGRMRLRARNYAKVDFLTYEWDPPTDFSPCRDLKGRTVRVTYRQIPGDRNRGEVSAIEVLK